MSTYFVSIKNTIYGTIISRPIHADSIDKAMTMALSLISKDEKVVYIGYPIGE